MSEVTEASPPRRALFRKALQTKVANLRTTGEVRHALYDRLVFNKVKSLIGGKADFIVIGSAPIAREVLEFGRVAFQC